MPLSPLLKIQMQIDFKQFLVEILTSPKLIDAAVYERRSLRWAQDSLAFNDVNLSTTDTLNFFDENGNAANLENLEARGLKIESDRLNGTRNKLGQNANTMSTRELTVIDAAIFEAAAWVQTKYQNLNNELLKLHEQKVEFNRSASKKSDELMQQQREFLNYLQNFYQAENEVNAILAQFRFAENSVVAKKIFIDELKAAIKADEERLADEKLEAVNQNIKRTEKVVQHAGSRLRENVKPVQASKLSAVEIAKAEMQKVSAALQGFARLPNAMATRLKILADKMLGADSVKKDDLPIYFLHYLSGKAQEDKETKETDLKVYMSEFSSQVQALLASEQYCFLINRYLSLSKNISLLSDTMKEELRIVKAVCHLIDKFVHAFKRLETELDIGNINKKSEERVELLNQFKNNEILSLTELTSFVAHHHVCVNEFELPVQPKPSNVSAQVVANTRSLPLKSYLAEKRKERDELLCAQKTNQKTTVEISTDAYIDPAVIQKMSAIQAKAQKQRKEIDALKIQKLLIVDIDEFLTTVMELNCSQCPQKGVYVLDSFFELVKSAQQNGFTLCFVTSIDMRKSFGLTRNGDQGLPFNKAGLVESLNEEGIRISPALIFDAVKTKDSTKIKNLVQAKIEKPRNVNNQIKLEMPSSSSAKSILSQSVLLGSEYIISANESNVMNSTFEAREYMQMLAEKSKFDQAHLTSNLDRSLCNEISKIFFKEHTAFKLEEGGEILPSVLTYLEELCQRIQLTNQSDNQHALSCDQQVQRLKRIGEQLLKLISKTGYYHQIAQPSLDSTKKVMSPLERSMLLIKSFIEDTLGQKAKEIANHPALLAKEFLEKAESYLRAKEWNVGVQLLGRSATIMVNGKEKKVPHTVKEQLDVIQRAKETGEYVIAKKEFLKIYMKKKASHQANFFAYVNSCEASRKYFNLFVGNSQDKQNQRDVLEQNLSSLFVRDKCR